MTLETGTGSSPAQADGSPLMQGVNLHNWYKGVHALKGVDFELGRSEVVGLVGDNSAGKSTLIKILSGAHEPDEGRMLFEGREVRFGNPRRSYTGSNIYKAAYDVAAAVTEMFPAEGDIHALVGNFDPTHNVGIARTEGMEQALADWKAANPGRNITWEQIEETLDPSIVRSRVGAYLQARPDTNVYLTSGIWHPEIAKMLREDGREKGEILIAGFGAFQWAIDEVKDGWIAVTQDQGAYLQGYLPIVQLYLLTKGLPPFNVDTEGALKGVVDAEAAPTLSGLRIWSLQ